MAHLDYNITIEWSDIYSQAERLSSYEGRSAYSASGESDYDLMHIASQDEDLVLEYIGTATNQVEGDLHTLTTGAETSDSEENEGQQATTYHFAIDSARVSTATLENMVKEAISSYVMMLWVTERKSSRQEFFMNLYQQMISSIKSSLTRKKKPSLDINYNNSII